MGEGERDRLDTKDLSNSRIHSNLASYRDGYVKEKKKKISPLEISFRTKKRETGKRNVKLPHKTLMNFTESYFGK